MSGDTYDLQYGPSNPHRTAHNGEARHCLETAARTFQPMTAAESMAILASLSATETDNR
jgi:hypothetical protein